MRKGEKKYEWKTKSDDVRESIEQWEKKSVVVRKKALMDWLLPQVDVLPPEATITEARPDENERLEAVPISAHTVQPSDNLPKLAKQTTPQEYANATGKVRHLIRHRIASCLKCGLATQPTNKRLGYSSRQFIIITNIVGKGPSKGRGYLILYGALHIRASLFREPFTIIIWFPWFPAPLITVWLYF